MRVVHVGDDRVVLVGAVHDHPASVYRAAAVVEDIAPAVVALELPSLAIPLFERFAVERTAGDPGGEMSAAIRASGDARIEGIDMPTTTYLGALARTVRDAAPAPGDLLDVVRETVGVTRHALRCRVAASSRSSVPVEDPVDAHDHDCESTAPPAVQADHEAARLSQSRSLLSALEAPVAARVVDTAREAAMARRLAALGGAGDVVAVVGFDHLDDVADRLADREWDETA